MSATCSFSELALQEDFEEVEVLRRGESWDGADRWSASLVSTLEVRVELAPAFHPDHVFHARLVWDRYPDSPPSLVFFDPQSGSKDEPRAWPTGGPFRPVTGLCVNYTREGFAMHPEWVNDARLRWQTGGNVLLKVLRFLQDDLDTGYSGRHQ